MSRKRRSGEKMLIQKQTKVRVLGAAMILALMFICSMAAFAIITVSPTSIQFPSQTVGTKSAPITVTITNRNRASVTISGASLSEPQFSFSGPAFPLVLGGGQSFTGTVTFTPSAAQAYNATLMISRVEASNISVQLSGTGVSPVSSSLIASPGALSFSATAGGAAPAAQSLSISEIRRARRRSQSARINHGLV